MFLCVYKKSLLVVCGTQSFLFKYISGEEFQFRFDAANGTFYCGLVNLEDNAITDTGSRIIYKECVCKCVWVTVCVCLLCVIVCMCV